MKRLAACTTVAALILAATSQARTYAERALPIAQHYWHQTACQGHIQTRWDTMTPDWIAYASWNGPDTTPTKDRTGCSITYSTRYHWAWYTFCRTTVHEYGHLLGYHHTRKVSVMNPDTRRQPVVHACL
jgi:hypothetical protein